MEDEKIVTLYFERSELAISETDRKYGGLCFSVANNILNSRPDSEECVSDTYLGLWNSIPPTKPASLRAYLLKIVRNISLSRLRKNLAKKRSQDLEISLSELENVLHDEKISPEYDNEEIGEIIGEFLRALDPGSRNIFLRRYWFFDAVSEICVRYGMGASAVKTSLHRTREKLRKYLTERGVSI